MPLNPFAHVVAVAREAERLLDELAENRRKLADAYGLLDLNPALAMALLERLRTRRSALRARLRANRIEARELLGRPVAPVAEAEPFEPCPN